MMIDSARCPPVGTTYAELVATARFGGEGRGA